MRILPSLPRSLLTGSLLAATLAACASNNSSSSSQTKSSSSSSAQTSQVYEEMPTPAQPNAQAPAETTSTSAASGTAAPAASGAVTDYTVKQGDSLWLIAHNHHTSVAKLKALNNLTSDVLHPGKVLKVPAEK